MPDCWWGRKRGGGGGLEASVEVIKRSVGINDHAVSLHIIQLLNQCVYLQLYTVSHVAYYVNYASYQSCYK